MSDPVNATSGNITVAPVLPLTNADGVEVFDVSSIIQSTYAHYIVFGCAIFAICWAVWCAFLVRKYFKNHTPSTKFFTAPKVPKFLKL